MDGRRLAIEGSLLVMMILGSAGGIGLVAVLRSYGVDLDAHRVLVAFLLIGPMVLLGALVGLATWVRCLRPFVSLEEMVAVTRHPTSPEWFIVALERFVRWAHGRARN